MMMKMKEKKKNKKNDNLIIAINNDYTKMN